MNHRALIAALLVSSILSGCASTGFDPATGLYAAPVGGAPATANATPLTPALTCLADTAATRRLAAPRLAVGEIADLTGKLDLETGRRVTQGASLFAVTALGRAGVPLVERADQTVAEVERTYAAARVLSDNPTGAGEDPGPVRPVNPGQIAGSRYYLVGGITELNYNIESSGGQLGVGAIDPEDPKTVLGGSRFVMNVAVDLRLVDSISQEVVAIAAYQKQIVGREIRAGVFDIFGGVAVDLSGGQSALEPLQLGVRALIERGVYDVAAELYGLTDSACLPPVQTADTAGGYRLLRSLQPPVTERPAQAFAAAPVPAPTRVPAAPPVRSGVPLASPLILPLPVSAGDPAVPAAAVPAEGTPARPRIDPRTWRVTRGG
ncbi:MAG: holdfast anchoring protein HfaB [Caulobacteraceae bacterium]|nr:holdfast anchoring protein HfaB [Caulobacteraceae bacterium]